MRLLELGQQVRAEKYQSQARDPIKETIAGVWLMGQVERKPGQPSQSQSA